MVWGSIIGAAAGLAGGAMSESSARSMQMRQERYTERQMQNAHQWEVQDLENAGLNPVLSANSAHAVGGASGQATDYASAMASGINATANAQTSASQSALNSAAATKTAVETENIPQHMKNETITAAASAQTASANAAETQAKIEQIKTLLPLEMQDKAAEIALKAQQGQLNKNEMETLENFGLTKSQIIQIGKIGADLLGKVIGKPTTINKIEQSGKKLAEKLKTKHK